MPVKKKQIQVDDPPKDKQMGTEVLRIVEAPKDEIVRAALLPQEMQMNIREYRAMQDALDRAMPDQLMQIKGRAFRKKGYWRAIRTAFGLSVEERKEDRVVNGTDWGYNVTYRAIAPNGKFADGDGSCMASEKMKKDDKGMFATEHNVRAHAHTRGFNRAVSNLVGFGEVSAEEAERDEYDQRPPVEQQRRPTDPEKIMAVSARQQTPQPTKLGEKQQELKVLIEKYVLDNNLDDGDKATIFKEVTAFNPSDPAKRSFPGYDNFDFSKLSDKHALAALKNYHKAVSGKK